MRRKNYLIYCLLLLIFSGVVSDIGAQSRRTTVILKNGKRLSGELLEDTANHVVLMNELGEIKVHRVDIETIHYMGYCHVKLLKLDKVVLI